MHVPKRDINSLGIQLCQSLHVECDKSISCKSWHAALCSCADISCLWRLGSPSVHVFVCMCVCVCVYVCVHNAYMSVSVCVRVCTVWFRNIKKYVSIIRASFRWLGFRGIYYASLCTLTRPCDDIYVLTLLSCCMCVLRITLWAVRVRSVQWMLLLQTLLAMIPIDHCPVRPLPKTAFLAYLNRHMFLHLFWFRWNPFLFRILHSLSHCLSLSNSNILDNI